jgi:cell shape-determining protein MreD
MIYCFYISACLGFLLLQTTLMPLLPMLDGWYDLLIPLVVYLGITRPIRESLPVVFFLGFSMDSLSGAPFGLYLTTYFWLFAGVKGINQLLQIGDRFLIGAMIVAAGVVVENFVFFATFLVVGTENPFAAAGLKSAFIQVLWAVCTGPLVLMFCRNAHHRLENSLRGIFYQRRRPSLP